MNENYKKERVLYFRYTEEYTDKVKELCDLLTANNIPHICYQGNGWPTEFFIRKSKATWNDVYKLVNSIHAVKYTFKTMYFNSDGKPVEYSIIYV